MKADPRTPPEFANLPKWLVAPGKGQSGKSKGHIVHCHFPRFIMAVDLEEGSGLPLWIDKPARHPESPAAVGQTAALVLEATDYYRGLAS